MNILQSENKNDKFHTNISSNINVVDGIKKKKDSIEAMKYLSVVRNNTERMNSNIRLKTEAR